MTRKQFRELDTQEKFDYIEEQTGLRIWTDVEEELRIYLDYAKNKYDLVDIIFEIKDEEYLNDLYEYYVVEISDYYEAPICNNYFNYSEELIEYYEDDLDLDEEELNEEDVEL